MELLSRAKRCVQVYRLIMRGYSYDFAVRWSKKIRTDEKENKGKYKKSSIKKLHEQGYLCRSASKYGYSNEGYLDSVPDFTYTFLYPYNNSFSKWLQDVQTTAMVLEGHHGHCLTAYFSIVQRFDEELILDKRSSPVTRCSATEILSFVREAGPFCLRPARWASGDRKYKLSYCDDRFYCDNRRISEENLIDLVRQLPSDYVLTDFVDLHHCFAADVSCRHYIRCWIANDDDLACGESRLLFTELALQDYSGKWHHCELDSDQGLFTWGDQSVRVDTWDEVKDSVLEASGKLSQLNYFLATIVLDDDGGYRFIRFSADPSLPTVTPSENFTGYFERKAAKKMKTELWTRCEQAAHLKELIRTKLMMARARTGIRPYMQKLWVNEVIDDFKNTKGISLHQKIWCWRRGFKSFRLWQYGLTEDNYQDFLSDYDYHWLNRINNSYQIWVNDKTTFKYALAPFSQFTPRYYFSIFKRGGQTVIEKMSDCPQDIDEGVRGIVQLLKKEGLLVLKMSAGTHGDGFYRLECADGKTILVNGEAYTKHQLEELIISQVSYYVVTEFVKMHPQLRSIYPLSVNTIRVMVVNRHGDDPKIMQSYMRIGSSSTGFTDNVAYGGVCAMVDVGTGTIYSPEVLNDHRYEACAVHPDTNVPISGVVPHWESICTHLTEICCHLAELEYLGFDVAVTEQAFQILEINIHQDLHKVASFPRELNSFFAEKIALKSKGSVASLSRFLSQTES